MDANLDGLIYEEAVAAAARFVQQRCGTPAATAIVLGTGLGGLAQELDLECTVPYADVPHFHDPSVESHAGRFLIGRLGDHNVLALQGRIHAYEGFTARQITLPIRVLGALGVKHVIVSNASGSLNPKMRQGDLVCIRDHINLQGDNPLIGPNVSRWGPRFPDMSAPYDDRLAAQALSIAREQGTVLHEGVYCAVTGPNLETPAEYRMLRRLGADLVGMSTVPEVLVARHMDIAVLAISIVTDECFGEVISPVSLDQILGAARAAEPRLTSIIRRLCASGDSAPAHR